MSEIKSTDQFFAEIFERRLETLREIHCPQEIIDQFSSQKEEVIETAKKIFPNRNHDSWYWHNMSAFLPVIPFTEEIVRDFWYFIYNYVPRSFIGLIKNLLETPQKPYFIYRVEDDAWCNFELKDKEKFSAKLGNRGLTMAEVLAFNSHYYKDCGDTKEKSLDRDVASIVDDILYHSPHPLEINQVRLRGLIKDRMGYHYRPANQSQLIVALGSRLHFSGVSDSGLEFIPCINSGRFSLDFITYDSKTHGLSNIVVPYCFDQRPRVRRCVEITEMDYLSDFPTKDEKLEDEEWFKEAMAEEKYQDKS